MLRVEELKDVDASLLDKLVKLEKEAFGGGGLNEWTLPVVIKYGKVFLLKYGQKIVGLAELIKSWENEDTAYLIGFSVKKGYRLKGLGSKFLGEILKVLKKEEVKELYLTVAPDNKAALRLYEKFGFLKEDFRKNFYGKGEDRFLMVKNLEGEGGGF